MGDMGGQMSFKKHSIKAFERVLNRQTLIQKINAILIFLNHFEESVKLPLDNVDSLLCLDFDINIMRFHPSIIYPQGVYVNSRSSFFTQPL